MAIEVSGAEDRHLLPLYHKRDLALVRGEGVYLWDRQGNCYLDMMSNYGTAILGHSHPAVSAAITEQAATLVSCHQSFYNDAQQRFVGALVELLPVRLRHLSFANSGAEAVEAALKYARAATGRTRLISARRSYHGRTIGALSVTGESKHRQLFGQLLPDCEYVSYDDLGALSDCIDGAAAVILEPIQGESGVRPASLEYLRGVRRLCDRTGTLLIFDEIQTAFRTGRHFAWQHSDVEPDVMTLSKPLANGLPIGLTIVSDSVAAAVPTGSHGSTFGGNPLVCAAGEAVLAIVASAEFQLRVAERGRVFKALLAAVEHPSVREVRGVGLMVAVELKRNASPVLQRMQRAGVLAIPAGSTSVRFLPPLIATEEQLETAARCFQLALE